MTETKSPTMAKFLNGNLMRHVAIMSLSSSLGLVFIFLVDFVDLFFISKLGEASQTAAVGFAGTLIFFNMAFGIGLMIAMSALASQRIGRGDTSGIKRIATSVLTYGVVIGSIMGLLIFILAPQLLKMIGAEGNALKYAVSYTRIIAPSIPIMMIGMTASGLLRAHGDAKRAMFATLSAGLVNAVLDPIFIFAMGWGLEGAAIASVCARIAMAITSVLPILQYYGGFEKFNLDWLREDIKPVAGIAGPAILTNVATPFGSIMVMKFIASYGDSAVAGFSVISRLVPLAFCVVFAVSGAVGPIIGLNFGAGDFNRVKQTLKDAIVFIGGYTLIVWVLLYLTLNIVINGFELNDVGAELVTVFVIIVAPLFFFNGVLFITNAAFNNLNRPKWSTAINWARNTIGILPFIVIGAHYGGAPGVMVAQNIGGVLFAGGGVWLSFRLINHYQTQAAIRVSQS